MGRSVSTVSPALRHLATIARAKATPAPVPAAENGIVRAAEAQVQAQTAPQGDIGATPTLDLGLRWEYGVPAGVYSIEFRVPGAAPGNDAGFSVPPSPPCNLSIRVAGNSGGFGVVATVTQAAPVVLPVSPGERVSVIASDASNPAMASSFGPFLLQASVSSRQPSNPPPMQIIKALPAGTWTVPERAYAVIFTANDAGFEWLGTADFAQAVTAGVEYVVKGPLFKLTAGNTALFLLRNR